MKKKKILLVYAPDYFFINDEHTPYGLICIKEVIQNDGSFDVEIIDYNQILYTRQIKNISANMIKTFSILAHEISEMNPDAVSFYTMCSNFYCCIPIAEELKKLCPSVVCIFAGPHATCIANNILENYPFVDYVAMGEGERNVIPFFKAIFNDTHNFGGLNGIAYRKEDIIVAQWDKKNRLSGYELPMIDLGQYYSINPDEFITLEGGRGCPFSCAFCSTQNFWGNVFVIKPVDMLISEIMHYYNKYGANKFSITHDLFTANKKHMLAFCRALAELPFKVEWGCSSRLDVLDEEMIFAMNQAGCTDMYIGVESGSPRIQKLISKNLDLELLNQKISLLLNGNTSCILSFIYGYPYEEEQDLELSLQKIYETKQIEKRISKATLIIQFHRLTYLPGTGIINDYLDKLEFEGINTMSYFDEDIEIHPRIKSIITNNKIGFLNCYNLKKNMNKFFNHLGDFVCLWFNLFYNYFSETIDIIILQFPNIIALFKYIYTSDSDFFLETARFYNIYFDKDRVSLLCSTFVDFIESTFLNGQYSTYDRKMRETLIKEYNGVKNQLNLSNRDFL